jgi:predicted porin
MNPSYQGKKLLFGLTACAAFLATRSAQADITLYDKDKWTVKTDGLAQGFYMLGMGDAAPHGGTAAPVRLDFLGTEPSSSPATEENPKFMRSRFRSGWTGGRFNWHITNQMTPEIKASAHLGIAYSISTQNAPPGQGGLWDVRNGFLEIEAPWGDLVVGRSVGLYTLGAIISTINNTSAGMGVGNTCNMGGDGLGCYTTGYGAKFPGFWAGVFYTTPDIGGLKIKIAALDPVTIGADVPMVSQAFVRTPLPHFQTLWMYNLDAGSIKVNPYFNGFWQQAGKAGTSDTVNALGGGAGIDLKVGIGEDMAFKIGAGGSFEHGTALYVPLFAPLGDTVDANPVPAQAKLRDGMSLYGHAMFTVGSVDLNAGYGQAGIKRTPFDETNNLNINKVQHNIYAGVQYHMKPLTFVAELNMLHHEWYAGNKQDVQVVSLGANFGY